MGETTLQDRRAAANKQKSNSYAMLKETALSFVNSQAYNAQLETRMDFPFLRSLTTPSFSHTFGPSHSVSCSPKLQGSFTIDTFITHLEGMIPNLDRWDIEVKGIVVDEVGASVVVRASYWMQVKGGTERVENDVVWWLEMEEESREGAVGEKREGGVGGWKVRKSTEMVDMGAAGRIRELMRGK